MKIVFSKEVIAHRVRELAKDILVDYHHKDLLILVVLKGGFVFGADLIRAMSKPNLFVDFISAASYKGMLSTGNVTFDRIPLVAAKGKEVLVVEDITDTGQTCAAIREKLLVGVARSLRFCVLLDKPSCREASFVPDYVGFSIPDKFVVGYGLDYEGKYRNLPDIYTFEEG